MLFNVGPHEALIVAALLAFLVLGPTVLTLVVARVRSLRARWRARRGRPG